MIMTKSERFLSEVFEQVEREDELRWSVRPPSRGYPERMPEWPDMEPAGWSYGFMAFE